MKERIQCEGDVFFQWIQADHAGAPVVPVPKANTETIDRPRYPVSSNIYIIYTIYTIYITYIYIIYIIYIYIYVRI